MPEAINNIKFRDVHVVYLKSRNGWQLYGKYYTNVEVRKITTRKLISSL